MSIQEKIDKRQRLIGLRNSASDHTRCPECNEQLIFCDCISALSEEILDDLLDGPTMKVWTDKKSIRKFVGQGNNKYAHHKTVEKGFGKYLALLIPIESGESK